MLFHSIPAAPAFVGFACSASAYVWNKNKEIFFGGVQCVFYKNSESISVFLLSFETVPDKR